MKSIVDDMTLKDLGQERMGWFRDKMPILKSIEAKHKKRTNI